MITGKSCVVETATRQSFGVLSFRVPAGKSEDEIKAEVCKAITRSYFLSVDHCGSAKRVTWWHHLIFRMPVTIVLQGAERKPDDKYAALDSAARMLSSDFGVRVIIDASSNSLPETAVATMRELLVEVEPMPRDVIEQMPHLALLHKALKENDLDDIVWMCVGGVPANYYALRRRWFCRGDQNLDSIVRDFVLEQIGTAIKNKSAAVAESDRVEQLFDLFEGSPDVPIAILSSLKVKRLSPDKVLRAVRRRTHCDGIGNGEYMLIPVDAAMYLVLRFRLSRTPSIKDLRAILLVLQNPVHTLRSPPRTSVVQLC